MSAPAPSPRNPPSKIPPFDVKRLRRKMGITQRHFAAIFGLSVGTLRHWELRNRRPTGTALVLLHLIADNPAAVRAAVRKARAKPGLLAAIEQTATLRASPGMRVAL